jgi:hypothetical protein
MCCAELALQLGVFPSVNEQKKSLMADWSTSVLPNNKQSLIEAKQELHIYAERSKSLLGS